MVSCNSLALVECLNADINYELESSEFYAINLETECTRSKGLGRREKGRELLVMHDLRGMRDACISRRESKLQDIATA